MKTEWNVNFFFNFLAYIIHEDQLLHKGLWPPKWEQSDMNEK